MTEQTLELITEEEKILREKNIRGLTILGQDHESQLLQQLSDQLDNLNNDEVENKEQNTNNFNILENVESKETNYERKIRLGEMTPFGTVLNTNSRSSEGSESQVIKYLIQQEELREKFKSQNITGRKIASVKVTQRKPRKISLGTHTVEFPQESQPGLLLSEKVTIDFPEGSGSEYAPSSEETDVSENEKDTLLIAKKRKRKKSLDSFHKNFAYDVDVPSSCSKSHKIKVHKELDDGDEDEYQNRLDRYEKSCDTTEIMFHELANSNFKIPLEIWYKLYNYQKVGVQWLWELHQQTVGGILADEMGLGKTIQLIAFLSGLYYSKLSNKFSGFRGLGPSIIVCPTTLMYQWVKEFHIWLSPIRVAVLHACGSFSGRKQNLIRDIYRGRGVLITSYVGMMQHSNEILRYSWHYAVLDEGHKIRNPDAKVALTVKQLKTPHRLILSGSPLQNNLEELWSLFDFIYPGKLGALPLFQAQFSVPITHGGYVNASNIEVTIAYKCATVLKEIISPYLLRRSKTDVKTHINLSQKNELVLFCQLTDCQRELYKSYIESGEVRNILEGQAQIFVGIINLRKICNHPDLYSGGLKLMAHENENDLVEEYRYGYWRKSGKMIVLETLLKLWHKQDHKVLLFTQSKQMLNILEIFLNSCNYSFLKLDGTTYIGSRQPLIDKFNADPNIFIMLLTTKVGGLGVNLTGANRIVIFDPDWNPATDTQARERAWRIGQTKDVTIYRFITVGTIEEKMYHRQIFKQFLTNKVLKDPKQRRFFKSNDLFELFTLKESSEEGSTETGAIFAGTGTEINKRILELKQKMKKKRLKKKQNELIALQFSKSKIEKMKQIAQQISQKLVTQMTRRGEVDGKGNSQSDNKVYSVGVKCVASCSSSSAPNDLDHEKNQDIKEVKTKILHENELKKSHFEGEHIPYLVSTKRAKMKMEMKDSEVKAVQDEYVLKKLFSKTGICSALQHDTIMEGGPADYTIVEKEAERVAQQAIDELKRSQERCFPAHTGIPNWTGRNGIRAKNQINSKVLTSSDILDKIKKRNGITEVSNTETKILKDLKTFIHSEGGTASTDRLIRTFEKEVPAMMTPLFKCLLNKICTFYRGPDRKGYWSLKNEFES